MNEREAWFDFPSIGFNNNEIFISGNLFTVDENEWETNFLYQIKTNIGSSGTPDTEYITYDEIEEPWSTIDAFTIVPISHGNGENYGSGIFMVSTENAIWNNSIYFYNVTGSIDEDPEIEKSTVDIDDFESTNQGAAQRNGGSDKKLYTGDCRILGTFFESGWVHVVFTKRTDSDESQIQYYRFRVEDLEPVSYNIFRASSFCAYPSIASLGNRRSAICFLRSSETSFPQIRLKILNRRLSTSLDSERLMVGSNFCDSCSNSDRFNGLQRWGDYSSIQKWYGKNKLFIYAHVPNSAKKWESFIIVRDF
jgi:hypothetical protein